MQTKKRGHSSAFFVIILASLLIAATSYAVHQYFIRQDMAIGETKRLAQQAEELQANGQSAEEKLFLEQQVRLEKQLRDSLERNPKDTSLLLPLGSARIVIGDTLGALKLYKQYVEVANPSNLAAQTDYAYLLFVSGKVLEGRERTLNVLKKQPKNQIAMYNLAAMSYKESKTDDAILWMKRCVSADTSSQIAAMARMALESLTKESNQH